MESGSQGRAGGEGSAKEAVARPVGQGFGTLQGVGGCVVNRDEGIKKLSEAGKVWDVLIIGGGATGLGAAVDAASRGYSVLLLEQCDFAKATSSRATKLAH